MSELGNLYKSNKVLFIGGGVTIAAFIYVYRKRAASAAAAATTTDPNATDPNATYDPNASGYGDYSAIPQLGGYYDPTTGTTISQGTPPPTVTAPTTNAAWAQQALPYLVSQGYSAVSVITALAKYLSGQGLANESELIIVEAAIGFEGQPPVSVPPPHLVPTPRTPTPSPKPRVPVPSGGLHAPHLTRVHDNNKYRAMLQWNSVPGATQYRLRLNGTVVTQTTQTHWEVPLHAGIWSVQAYNGYVHSSPSNLVVLR